MVTKASGSKDKQWHDACTAAQAADRAAATAAQGWSHHHRHPVALKVQVDGGPLALAAHGGAAKLHKGQAAAGRHHPQVLAGAILQAEDGGARDAILQGSQGEQG